MLDDEDIEKIAEAVVKAAGAAPQAPGYGSTRERALQAAMQVLGVGYGGGAASADPEIVLRTAEKIEGWLNGAPAVADHAAIGRAVRFSP